MHTIIKKEFIGPWILAAAATHAMLLILGIAVLVELQKMQVRQSLEQLRQQTQQRLTR